MSILIILVPSGIPRIPRALPISDNEAPYTRFGPPPLLLLGPVSTAHTFSRSVRSVCRDFGP